MESTSPVGWLSLLPPLITIVLAIASKRVVLSLLIGIVSAIVILLPSASAQQVVQGADFTWGGYVWDSLSHGVVALLETHLWSTLFLSEDHLRVFAFTTLLGMQVAMIHQMGGMLGIVQWATPFIRTRRGGQVMTWLLGMVIFIDDYANTLLLGSTMRPVTDRLRISREKLAFLVDSTAAPVSGLALVSTWVATEIGNMEIGYKNAGIDIGDGAFGIFVKTIPTRFYVLFALVFVLLCALMGRDFGPMLKAERRALSDAPEDNSDSPVASDAIRGRAMNAILPILLTVLLVVWLLVVTGIQASGIENLPRISDFQAWGQIIGQGNSYVALLYGAMGGLIACLLLNIFQRLLDPEAVRKTLLQGFLHVLPALVILWLAWTLSNLTGEDYLGTGNFLADKLNQSSFNPAWMPTVVFLMSAGIAFSTGTSWGTMAIVMPMVIPLVYGLLAKQDGGAMIPPDHFLLTASIGSVLAGAIFGDHCSPISDTTILSSRSSDCNHIAHVRTQMPYALVVGLVSILLGTIPAGFNVSSLYLLPAGITAMAVVLFLFGRHPERT